MNYTWVDRALSGLAQKRAQAEKELKEKAEFLKSCEAEEIVKAFQNYNIDWLDLIIETIKDERENKQ